MGVRVLMVIGPATGGIGAHAESLADQLPGHGIQVTVFTHPVTAARFDFGVHVIEQWPQGSPLRQVRALRRLRRLIRAADVVHAQGHHAAVLVRLAALGLRAPLVVSWHNAILAGGLRRRLLALAERWQVAGARLVTGASTDLVERAVGLGADRAELAPVASPSAQPWPQSQSEAKQRLIGELSLPRELGARDWLVTVSRIAPQKNLHVLLAAARLVHQRCADTALKQDSDAAAEPVWFVVGDGDTQLLDTLSGLIGPSAVHFAGARTDVPLWLAAASVVVLPSAWEARSLVVQEAMAAGKAVVASDVGGLPDLLGADGVLVPPGDPVELADQVQALLADAPRREQLGRRARERFATLPGVVDVAAAWVARYAQVAGSTERRASG